MDKINFKYVAMAAGALASVLLAELLFEDDVYYEVVEPPRPVDDEDEAEVTETTITTEEITND